MSKNKIEKKIEVLSCCLLQVSLGKYKHRLFQPTSHKWFGLIPQGIQSTDRHEQPLCMALFAYVGRIEASVLRTFHNQVKAPCSMFMSFLFVFSSESSALSSFSGHC